MYVYECYTKELSLFGYTIVPIMPISCCDLGAGLNWRVGPAHTIRIAFRSSYTLLHAQNVV